MNNKHLIKVEEILEEYATYVYFDRDPMRGGIDRDSAVKKILSLILSEKKESYDEGFSNGVEIGRVTKKPENVTKYKLPKLRYKLSQLEEVKE